MDKELIVVKGKVIEQERGYHANIGKDIGYEAGAKMIKRSVDQNPDDAIAHFMGRNIIEQILAQPGCIGIRTFYGLNEIGIRQLVYVGVDMNGNNILQYTIQENGELLKKKGIVADMSSICPPKCGGAVGDSSDSGWF